MNGNKGGHQALPAESGPPATARPGIVRRLAPISGPIVMAALFFAVLTPIAVAMRICGRDPLRLRPRRDAASYWLPIAARGPVR